MGQSGSVSNERVGIAVAMERATKVYRRQGADGVERLGRCTTAAGLRHRHATIPWRAQQQRPSCRPHLRRRHAAAGQAAQPGKEIDKSGWVDQGPGVALQLGIVQLALEGMEGGMKWRAMKHANYELG